MFELDWIEIESIEQLDELPDGFYLLAYPMRPLDYPGYFASTKSAEKDGNKFLVQNMPYPGIYTYEVPLQYSHYALVIRKKDIGSGPKPSHKSYRKWS